MDSSTAKEYKGLDNRDLRLINIHPWDIPKPCRNKNVKLMLDRIAAMKPGEATKGEGLKDVEVRMLRSALWRQIKKHGLSAKLTIRGGELYITKVGE